MNLSFSFRWADRRRPAFLHPMPAAARAAILEPGFRCGASSLVVDPLTPGAADQIRDFQPATLAGRLDAVIALAGSVSPTHAVVIFTLEGERCLAESDRDWLWQYFRVPVFEQVITSDARLVAWECEAHEGLHLCDGAQHAADRIVVDACECGSSAARVSGGNLAPALNGVHGVATLFHAAPRESRQRPIPT